MAQGRYVSVVYVFYVPWLAPVTGCLYAVLVTGCPDCLPGPARVTGWLCLVPVIGCLRLVPMLCVLCSEPLCLCSYAPVPETK